MNSKVLKYIFAGLVALPFLYVYCYQPIVYGPLLVAPKECFSKSIQLGVSQNIKKELSRDIYNLDLTSSEQKKLGDNENVFYKMTTITHDYTTVSSINKNNGSVVCNASFHARLITPSGKGAMLESGVQADYN